LINDVSAKIKVASVPMNPSAALNQARQICTERFAAPDTDWERGRKLLLEDQLSV
jgi:hypothetical protein